MTIYTSYYGNIKNIPAEYNLVGISLSIPKGIMIRQYKKLAPTWPILNEYKRNGENVDQYVKSYYAEILSKLDPHVVVKEIGENPVLLCYEKSGFCHRHVVAEWLRDAGYEVIGISKDNV